MLFNSAVFLFFFLPLTLLGFFVLGTHHKRAAILWLVIASSIFYGWFRMDYLLLLASLIVFNYMWGKKLSRQYHFGQPKKWLLALGVVINLGVLCYFKYTNFLLININSAFETNFVLQNIIMPIGISFFIFQKIAYLVDAHQGKAEEYNFLDFCLFVMYFPQLIAGPIVHHNEIIPQFRQDSIFKLNFSDMAAGLMMFTIGLCKKNLIADKLAAWIEPSFSATQQGWNLSFLESWVAALGFTFQIYFDFSAYTDMALGLALMIGIRLPQNFDSPYKAKNIIDFWRRWHMTLSRFLRDYVYIPLGGNRNGSIRRYNNLLLTMLIGGLWHGAAWTFIVWGTLHGLFLIVNHGWQILKAKLEWNPKSFAYSTACQILTFLSVVGAWVFFRAQSFDSAKIMLKGMIGLNGIALPAKYESRLGFLSSALKSVGLRFDDVGVAYLHGFKQFIFLLSLTLIVFLLPNTQQWCSQYRPVINKIETITLKGIWNRIPGIRIQNDNTLTLAASSTAGVIFGLLLLGSFLWQIISNTSLQTFIYFQF